MNKDAGYRSSSSGSIVVQWDGTQRIGAAPEQTVWRSIMCVTRQCVIQKIGASRHFALLHIGGGRAATFLGHMIL